MHFEQISVSKKLNYILFLVFATFLLVLGVVLYSFVVINQKAKKKDDLTKLSEQVWKTRQGYNAVRADLFQVLFISRINDLKGIENAKALYKKRIESIDEATSSIESSKTILSDSSRIILEKFVDDISYFAQLTTQKFNQVVQTKSEEELNLLEHYFSQEYNKDYSRLRNQSTIVQAAILKEYDLANTESLTTQNRIIYFTVLLVFLIILILSFVFTIIRRSIVQSILQTKNQLEILSKGEIPEIHLTHEKTEFYLIKKSIFEYVEQLKRVLYFTTSVGESRFTTEVNFFEGNGPIAKSLIKMREGLLQAHKNNQAQNWHNAGIAQLSDILQENKQDLETLYSDGLSFIIKYINANQGALFITEHAKETELLVMKACYAYNRKKYLQKTILPGEGLIGSTYLEKETVILTEVPNDYIKISSGLGEAKPTCIGMFPLIFNHNIEGVMEIASFSILSQIEISFLEATSKMIAAEITHLKLRREK